MMVPDAGWAAVAPPSSNATASKSAKIVRAILRGRRRRMGERAQAQGAG
jgi:hypothetical protein